MEYTESTKIKNKIPFTIMYDASLKSVNEKIRLLKNAIAKNIIEIVLISDVVRGKSNLIPIVNVSVMIKKSKLPKVSKSLLKLTLNILKP